MRVVPLGLDGIFRIEQAIWRDERGAFLETWNKRELARCGIDVEFVQDNMSRSRQWTIRGLHYQLPNPQGKFLRVLNGSIHDVVVDLRRASPTFGRSLSISLSSETGDALWIPAGFAHGFLALSEETLVSYKVTDYWMPASEKTLLWSDPELRIDWPIPAGVTPIVSTKDAAGAPLAAATAYA